MPYEVGRSGVIPVTVTIELEAEIPELRRVVQPASDIGSDIAYPLSAGSAIAEALLAVTETYFEGVEQAATRGEYAPRVKYTLLEYNPEIRFEPVGVATTSYAAARLAIRAELYRGPVKVLSTVVFGTGHVGDSKMLDRFGTGPTLLEAATQDAIVDAVYELSAFFDNNREAIGAGLNPPPPPPAPRPFDDVVLYLDSHSR
ncbi:MAG: hypothetical protein P8172_09225 [Gammaproteobacteria bacterium]